MDPTIEVRGRAGRERRRSLLPAERGDACIPDIRCWPVAVSVRRRLGHV